MIKKIVCLFAFMILSVSSYAEEKGPIHKIYPPYPNVWGYDLSEYPAIKWGGGGINAYRMADGDIWFVIAYSSKIKKPTKIREKYTEQKYVLIKFFKGEEQVLNVQELHELNTILEDAEWINSTRHKMVQFSDGSALKRVYGHTPKLCTIPDVISGYFIKTDSDGNEKKYSILGVYPQIEVQHDQGNCETQGALFIYQKLYLFEDLVDLRDNTFLVFSNESNLILRFEKDLNTHFKPRTPVNIPENDIHRNFFVIEYSLIEDLEHKYILEHVPVYQTVHDELLMYFKEKYPRPH